MGIEPFLITSSLKLIISQRLVKKLCPKCSTTRRIQTEAMQKKVNDYIGGVIEEKVEDIDFYEPKGCEVCGKTGYD
jgi:type II secretory ATPase GspE/PulE/Tfp pilus assembly ATPase PilB-like protein